ncbi:hypothetical protein PVAND_005872 [Polypedilum vanderplanki]|uniref:Uncharacterized protein n=1 Tax=Polypedilum vanderplanki TaxID=319348 RepID=A0A9J6C1F0_POLVA|nr:hypothetical protein PVAND_005872 [Polypedilum vanderplanki]
MRLSVIFLVALICASAVFGCDDKCQAKKAKRAQEKALQKACKELGGGTKIKLEIDLDGACHPPCKNKQKKKKKAPKEVKTTAAPEITTTTTVATTTTTVAPSTTLSTVTITDGRPKPGKPPK